MVAEQFSSFQIGKLLNVSRQAVNQWIDKGYIVSYRTPGGHRRVRRGDLIEFLRQRNIPIPDSLKQIFGEAIRPQIGRPHVMVVDDDHDFLTLLRRAIEEQVPEAAVSIYRNGFDALVDIGVEMPDLLVLDLKMPKIDGLEVCRRLKKNVRTCNIPIMIVTAFDKPEWRGVLKDLKVEEVCSKQTPILEMVGRISLYLSGLTGARK